MRIAAAVVTLRLNPVHIGALIAVLTVLVAACGRFGADAEGPQWGEKISCTPDVVSDRTHHTQVLREVRDRYMEELMAIPGVVDVAIAAVSKDGQLTGEVGIAVYVDPNLPPEQVDPEGLVPSTIEGCLVTTERDTSFSPAAFGHSV